MKRLLPLLILLFASAGWGAVAHSHLISQVSGTDGCTTGATCTIAIPAGNTNDGWLIITNCGQTYSTADTLTATGWIFTKVSATLDDFGNSTGGFNTLWKAYAPNTSSATATWTHTGTTCVFSSVVGDSFSGADLTNFVDNNSGNGDGFQASSGSGCTAHSITPSSNNDMIWFGCYDSGTGAGAGWTKGGDDTSGDYTIYQLLAGGAGAAKADTSGFTGTTAGFTEFGIAIKPAAGAAALSDFDKQRRYEQMDQ